MIVAVDHESSVSGPVPTDSGLKRSRLVFILIVGILIKAIFYVSFLPQAMGSQYVINSDHAKRELLALSAPIEVVILIGTAFLFAHFTPKSASRNLAWLVLLVFIGNVILLIDVSGMATI